MENVSVYKGIKQYMRRKGYERLRRPKSRSRVVQLGGGGSAGKRRFWRIRRLKLKLRFSPRKFLIGLRDAYVSLMMRIANSRFVTGGYGGGGFSDGFATRAVKEYDEKMLVELYKSIVVAQGKLVVRDAGKFGS